MIDLIINAQGGVSLAHTLKALDGYDTLDIDIGDGSATLSGPAGQRPIGSLSQAMLDAFRPGQPGQMVRTSGWSIVRVSPLHVRACH